MGPQSAAVVGVSFLLKNSLKLVFYYYYLLCCLAYEFKLRLAVLTFGPELHQCLEDFRHCDCK